MSFRRFIALLCLIAGSFGSGTVAALGCAVTIGRSCQGVDSVFYIDAQFPLDNRSHLVIDNRGAAECTLGGSVLWWRGSMYIPGGGAIAFYSPGKEKLIVSEGRRCDLSIRVEQDSLALPSTFDIVCPPMTSYSDGLTVGDWKFWIQSGETATVWRWNQLTSRLGRVSGTTEVSCESLGQNTVYATKVIPGIFSCAGKSDDRNIGPLQGTCQRR